MTAPFEPLPQALRLLRLRQRLTQADLARAAGVSKQRIGEFERGVARPRLDLLDRLLLVLHVDALELAETLQQVREKAPHPSRRYRGPRRCGTPPGDPATSIVAFDRLLQSLAAGLTASAAGDLPHA